MKKQICTIMIVLIMIISANSFASENWKWLISKSPSSTDITTGLSSCAKNIGECVLATGESLAPQAQYSAEQLANTWSSLPRETQQIILGGAVLATAAYNTPTLYHYLRGTVEKMRNEIINRAQNAGFVTDYPLTILKEMFPGSNNLYATVLDSFNFNVNPQSPPLREKRGHLLFFKYLKASVEDRIYAVKKAIQDQISGKSLGASSFMQRWITGRSEEPYRQLNQLISFNKDLTDIIAQLDKEIEAELNIY